MGTASRPFSVPSFYPILDTALLRRSGYDVRLAAEAILRAGVQVLQYRHKDAWTQTDFNEAEQIRNLCVEQGCVFVINDRADFARVLGAGLHVGQYDLPPVAARKIIESLPLGFSTHNRRQLTYGNDEPVDYLSIGPIYPTTSKLKPDPVVGIAGVKTLRPITKKKVVAIGGISLENAAEVFRAGADSVAVISELLPPDRSYEGVTEIAKRWLQATATDPAS